MPVNPVDIYSNAKLEALAGFPQVVDAVALMPNTTYEKGTILGQVSAASTSQIQTLNWSGAGDVPTGGTFILKITGIDGGTFSTAALAYNISNANLKIAIEALLEAAGYAGATVTIAGGACPVDVTVTFGGTSAYWDMPVMTYDITSITSSGTATLAITATTAGNRIGLFGPYVGTKLASPTAGPTATSAATGSLPVLGQFVVTYTHLTDQGESLPSPGTPVALTTTDQSIDVTPNALPAGTTGIRIYLNGVFAEESTQTTATLVNVGACAATAETPMPVENTAFTNTDGRHIAKAITQYTFRTDYMGRVVYAAANQSPQYGAYETTSPVYFAGAFQTSELTGLDAKAAADLGKIIKGTVTDGVLVV